jgi:predicted dehydrogenase
METVRWGVLSTAKIAREKVVPGIRAAANSEVVAIAGRDPERTRAVADDLGIAVAHAGYEDLLADPQVDAVYIPLPNHLHTRWTLAAAAAGKHVLCEKPLALDAAAAGSMVEACEQAGVLLMEAFMYRLHPSWRAVVDMVRGGRIGELTGVQSWFSYFNDDPGNIRNIAEYGGGALLDIGCYGVNLSRLLFGGEPDQVAAAMTLDPATGVDVLTSAILGFGGRSSTFTCCTRCEPDQRVHIYGTDGRIEIEIPFNIPPDRPTRVHVTSGGRPPTDPGTETVVFDAADQYAVQAEEFAQAVLSDGPVPVPAGDAVGNASVIDRIRDAAGAAPAGQPGSTPRT